MNNIFSEIERIVSFDIGNRGIGNLVCPGDLKESVYQISSSKNIAVVTGFYVLDAMAGETDGPGGAISLCEGLQKLNKNTSIITDDLNFDLLQAGLRTNPRTHTLLLKFPMENAAETARSLFDQYRFDHLVFIERSGPATDGENYNARGFPITPYTAKTDFLVTEAFQRQTYTTGVGDGGNEIGMGKVFDKIQSNVHLGEKIGCKVSTDYLLTCGTSNWGGWALLAGLSILNNRNLMPDKDFEIPLLKNIVSAGAVDALTKKSALSIDGFPIEQHLAILEQLQSLVNDSIKQGRGSREGLTHA